MIIVKGRKTSGNVMKVLWILEELCIPYTQEDIGGKHGGNNKQEYLKKNPTGLVPTLVDDQITLWESNTIVRYLAKKYSFGNIYPKSIEDAALLEMWMDWQLFAINPMMRPVFHGLIRNSPENRNWEEINKAIELGNSLWKILDNYLENKSFMGGEKIGVADFPLGPVVHRFFTIVDKRPPTPNIERWYENLQKRDAFKKICMIPLE